MPHAVSDQQRAANRANAARSTGPRTPQGKARSAQNARKHGFTASSFAVVRLEDLQDVEHLMDDLVAAWQPVNSQELFALERMAIAQQTLLRAARLESGLFTTCLNEALGPDERPLILINRELAGDDDGSVTRAQNRNYLLAEGFHRMAHYSNSWALFMRYHAQCERHYRRTVEEFERLKALRTELQAEFPNEPISGPQPEQTAATTDLETNPILPPEPVPPLDPELSGPASEPTPAAATPEPPGEPRPVADIPPTTNARRRPATHAPASKPGDPPNP
jgi:hypothetical protein